MEKGPFSWSVGFLTAMKSGVIKTLGTFLVAVKCGSRPALAAPVSWIAIWLSPEEIKTPGPTCSSQKEIGTLNFVWQIPTQEVQIGIN